MAGENNRSIEGLGAGKMQVVGDFKLLDETGAPLFTVDMDNGNLTAAGTVTGGGVGSAPGGASGNVQFNNAGAFGGSANLNYNEVAGELTLSGGDGETHFVAIETSTFSTSILQARGDLSSVGVTSNHDFGIQTNSLDRIKILKTGEVGIGTSTPSANLDLVGTLQYTDGNQATNKVLTSDASGNATWGPIVTTGTHSPTITIVSNLDSATLRGLAYFTRIGDIVSVSVGVDADPTLPSVATEFGVSLPIASNFVATENCIGVGSDNLVSGRITADSANDRANISYVPSGAASSYMVLNFTYRIL